MNKDMINIDDFVREKLGSREEKEDPAAWLRMKALLDKEMPEKAIPIGFRFGRPAVYLGCALLAALLSVGGYKLLNKTNEITPAAVIHNGGQSAAVTASNTTATGTAPMSINATAANAANNKTGTINNNANPDNTTANNRTSKSNVTTGTTALSRASGITATNAAGHNSRHNQQLSASSALGNTHTASATPAPTKDQHNNNANNFNSGSATGNTGTKQSQPVIAANTNANSKINNSTTANNGTAADKTNKAPSSPIHNNSSNTAPVNQPQTPENKDLAANEKRTKDSMTAVGVIKRATTTGTLPRKTVYTIDSLDLGKVAVSTDAATGQSAADPATEKTTLKNTAANNYGNPRYLGANPPQHQQIAAATVTPAAATPESTAATTGTAEQMKRKQKRDFLAFLKNINMEEIVDNVKYDVGHAQFYLGATGGLSSSLGAKQFRGPQFGVSGELVFNKHLSLMGELKYINRSGGNKTVDDSYTSEHTTGKPDSTVGSTSYYTVLTDSTRRYFNFSTLHSFEMPVTLRYAIGKFYLMTGINVGYYLGLNVEEVNDYSRVNTNPTVVSSTLSKNPDLHKGAPRININDFGSRYAIGYIFGAGYQITPALQTDLRIISPFWDNARTVGAQQISKDFYRIPSLQISINYQFNREKRKPATFGPGQR